MISKGNTCVEPEHNPRIEVPLGIPGFHGRGAKAVTHSAGTAAQAAVAHAEAAKALARTAGAGVVARLAARAKSLQTEVICALAFWWSIIFSENRLPSRGSSPGKGFFRVMR